MELDTNLIAIIAASALALMMGWFGLQKEEKITSFEKTRGAEQPWL